MLENDHKLKSYNLNNTIVLYAEKKCEFEDKKFAKKQETATDRLKNLRFKEGKGFFSKFYFL